MRERFPFHFRPCSHLLSVLSVRRGKHHGLFGERQNGLPSVVIEHRPDRRQTGQIIVNNVVSSTNCTGFRTRAVDEFM